MAFAVSKRYMSLASSSSVPYPLTGGDVGRRESLRSATKRAVVQTMNSQDTANDGCGGHKKDFPAENDDENMNMDEENFDPNQDGTSSVKRQKVAHLGIKSSLLLTLPHEIHHEILLNLSDHSVNLYSQTCSILHSVVDSHFWHKRFIQQFDLPDIAAAENRVGELARKYLSRQSRLQREIEMCAKEQDKLIDVSTGFDWSEHERTFLGELGLMITESAAYRCDAGNEIIAKNHHHLRDFVLATQQVDTSFRSGFRHKPARCNIIEQALSTRGEWTLTRRLPVRDPLNFTIPVFLCLAQIALTPLPHEIVSVHLFEQSQRQMYIEHTPALLFGRHQMAPNLRWFAHALNFWRLHLTLPNEGLFEVTYKELMQSQRPLPWLGRLKEGTQRLGKYWKGCHVYNSTPIDVDLDDVIIDEVDIPSFADGVFSFEHAFTPETWPSQFEKVLHSMPGVRNNSSIPKASPGARTSPPREVEYFSGTLSNPATRERTYLYGAVHGVPAEIQGFQRITWIYFVPVGRSSSGVNGDSYSHAWGYEGIVLPGGRIIMGQYWHVHIGESLRECGPFIMWNIDSPELPMIKTAGATKKRKKQGNPSEKERAELLDEKEAMMWFTMGGVADLASWGSGP